MPSASSAARTSSQANGSSRASSRRADLDHRDVAAEAPERLGQLDADRATAEHEQTVRYVPRRGRAAVVPRRDVAESGHRRDRRRGFRWRARPPAGRRVIARRRRSPPRRPRRSPASRPIPRTTVDASILQPGQRAGVVPVAGDPVPRAERRLGVGAAGDGLRPRRAPAERRRGRRPAGSASSTACTPSRSTRRRRARARRSRPPGRRRRSGRRRPPRPARRRSR